MSVTYKGQKAYIPKPNCRNRARDKEWWWFFLHYYKKN